MAKNEGERRVEDYLDLGNSMEVVSVMRLGMQEEIFGEHRFNLQHVQLDCLQSEGEVSKKQFDV